MTKRSDRTRGGRKPNMGTGLKARSIQSMRRTGRSQGHPFDGVLPPINLTSVWNGSGVDLGWEDNPSNENVALTYLITRAGQPDVEITAPTTTYTDTRDLVPGERYVWYINLTTVDGTSAFAGTEEEIPDGPPAPSLPAWAAASSEYMVTGSGSHEFLAQLVGAGTPTFDTPAGLLLPDYEGVYHEIPEDTMPVYGSRVVTNIMKFSNDFTDASYTKNAGVTVTTGIDDPFGGNNASTMSTTSNTTGLYAIGSALVPPFSVDGQAVVASGWIRRRTGVGGAGLYASSNTRTVVPVDGEWKRFSINIASGATGNNSRQGFFCNTGGDEIDIYGLQYEVYPAGTIGNLPSEYLEATGAAITKHFTNLNGNTVTNNVVTEAEGAPLLEMPSLYAAPAATNVVTWSRDATNAAWVKTGVGLTTFDQVGITGEPNTASLVNDDNETLYYVFQDATVASAANRITIRYIIKKDSDVSRFVQLQWRIMDPTISFFIRLNTSTGESAIVNNTHPAGSNPVLEVESVGDWWHVYLEQENTTGTTCRATVVPAAGTDINSGIFEAAATGSCIVGNLEVYDNTTISQCRGSAPIVTSGATITNALVTDVFDSLNMSDTQGAIYIEAKMPLANNVLSTFIETVGANYRVNDGTTTATQPWTADTWQKVGIAYDATEPLMAINVDGVWSSDAAYDGTLLSGALDLFRTPAGADIGRNIQRWDLSWADARSKVEELML